MADMEPFTLIGETSPPGPHHLFDDMVELTSGKTADHSLQYITSLREANPGTIVTAIPLNNVPLRLFAAAGFATCERDSSTDSFASWRGYVPPSLRQNRGHLAESIFFAKYRYSWKNEDFILYTVPSLQFVLKECREGESPLGPSKVTDTLIQTIGDWLRSDQEVVWVYDRYWTRSKQLWQEAQKMTWDKVILDERQKKDLTTITNKFFSSKAVYEDLGVAWKRGVIFHGPPGNGKTISVKALIHTLLQRNDPVPTLYVKNAPTTYDIRNVFTQARALSPCMLVLEDIETIVTPQTRSYFFNELDGLENNDGLFVVASTNFLERLDPGLSNRPSRFDRKYLFPLPNEHERTLYCEYWRHKLESKPSIEFPEALPPAMARITEGFSFAFLQECFVATLLILARGDEDETHTVSMPYGNGNELDQYELWRVFKQQADILRKEVSTHKPNIPQSTGSSMSRSSVSVIPHLTDSPMLPHGERRAGAGCDEDLAIPNLQDLQVRDEVLPALPYTFQSKAYVNSAAFEYKI